MKKFSKKTAKAALHKKWSLAVRTRDGRCQWCGRTEGKMDAHHIVPKSVSLNAGRYELENGMTLCFRCHQHLLPTDPDGYIKFRDEWLKARGLDFHELRFKYREVRTPFTKDFYETKLMSVTANGTRGMQRGVRNV